MGRMFVLAGVKEGSDDVFELRRSGDGIVARRLTRSRQGRGIGSFSIAGNRLAVQSAATATDRVATGRIRSSGTVKLRDLGPGSYPAIREDGTLAYLRPTYRTGSFRRLLAIRRGRRTRAFELPGRLSMPQWIGRRLAVASVRKRRASLILDADGRRRRVRTSLPEAGTLTVSPAGAIAYGYVGRIWLRPPSGEARTLRIPWKPVAWAPDSKMLLVANLKHELALLDPRDDAPQTIGRLIGAGLRGGVWLRGR